MPLYVYSCPTCDVVLDELRPMELADWPPVECPVCHGLCEREVSRVTILSTGARAAVEALADGVAGVPEFAEHGPDCSCCARIRSA